MNTLHLKPRAPAPSTLTAARLKVTTTLIPSEVLGAPAPNGVPRVTLRIQLPDRVVTAEVAAKSLRKAQTAIREQGGDNVVLMLRGKLVAGERIDEAGLSVQPKQPKPQLSQEQNQ